MKRYFLFDLDGTLTDTGEGIMACARYALEAFGVTGETDRELRKFVGPPLELAFSQFYGLTGEDLALAVKRYRTHYREVGVYLSPLYPGADRMLARAAACGTVCLATSKPQFFAEKILDMRGVRQHFSVLVGAGLDGTRSDKAEVIREVLRQLGDPDLSQVLMVGDRRQDILGARTVGVDSLGVAYGYADPGELEEAGATRIVQTVEDVADLLEALSQGGTL